MTRKELINSPEYMEVNVECELFRAFGDKKPRVSARLAKHLTPRIMEIIKEIKELENPTPHNK
jgi:hypothetical protein